MMIKNDIKKSIGWRMIAVAPLQLFVVQQVISRRNAPATIDCSLQLLAHAFNINVVPGNCIRVFWQLSAFDIVAEHVEL
jgi:hypothetical protein